MAFIIDGTTGIATVDGSVAAPSQRGQDNNSGISYAADTIKFSTGGVERMAIDNSAVVAKGYVLQVVSGDYTTTVSTTSGSYVDTGLSKSITPLQTGSFILVLIQQHVKAARLNNSTYLSVKIVQDSTDIFTNAVSYQMGMQAVGSTNVNLRFPMFLSYFHTHGVSAGTSTTYKTQILTHHTSNSSEATAQDGGSASRITLMEIGV